MQKEFSTSEMTGVIDASNGSVAARYVYSPYGEATDGGAPSAGVSALPGAGIGTGEGAVGGAVWGGINGFINAWNTRLGTSDIVVAGRIAEQGLSIGVSGGIFGPLGAVPSAASLPSKLSKVVTVRVQKDSV